MERELAFAIRRISLNIQQIRLLSNEDPFAAQSAHEEPDRT
jgi:hypothetical protein